MLMSPELLERERLLQLDTEVERIDSEDAEAVVLNLVHRYQYWSDSLRATSPTWQWPLWQLLQDIERQAAVYGNIIEDLKSGKDAGEVKQIYETSLGLVPQGRIHNPWGQRALDAALRKARQFATTVVVFIRDFGQTLLSQELGFGAEHTATLQVQLGLSPSVTLGTEYTGSLSAQ